jgi:hypothetical protein
VCKREGSRYGKERRGVRGKHNERGMYFLPSVFSHGGSGGGKKGRSRVREMWSVWKAT